MFGHDVPILCVLRPWKGDFTGFLYPSMKSARRGVEGVCDSFVRFYGVDGLMLHLSGIHQYSINLLFLYKNTGADFFVRHQQVVSTAGMFLA